DKHPPECLRFLHRALFHEVDGHHAEAVQRVVNHRAYQHDLHRDHEPVGVEGDGVVIHIAAEPDEHDIDNVNQEEEDKPDTGSTVQNPGVLTNIAMIDGCAVVAKILNHPDGKQNDADVGSAGEDKQ